MTRVLPVAILATGLCACSGGVGLSAASPAATATVTVTASTTPSPAPSPSPSASPSALPTASPSVSVSDSAQATPSASPSIPGGRGVDATVHGQLALRGVDAITVTPESDQEVKALLLPFTEVIDPEGVVCSDGKAPRSCSMEQLQEALQKDAVVFAEVTIKDGVAVRIDKITEE
ncbi:hypothetical protein ACLQ2R_36070 [Streptosporangium sp. DT93]|uniref:hypothetical protein n=1 Tax=Streptosporangium sp. DT93 TaxID=3393428 RepID=UPI003CEF374C